MDPKLEYEFEQAAQKAGEQRLAACLDALYADDHDDRGVPIAGPSVESPAIAPFCGCDTCIVREVLDAAWPHLLALAKAELAETGDQ